GRWDRRFTGAEHSGTRERRAVRVRRGPGDGEGKVLGQGGLVHAVERLRHREGAVREPPDVGHLELDRLAVEERELEEAVLVGPGEHLAVHGELGVLPHLLPGWQVTLT